MPCAQLSCQDSGAELASAAAGVWKHRFSAQNAELVIGVVPDAL